MRLFRGKALNSQSCLDFRWCCCSKLCFLLSVQQDFYASFSFANLVVLGHPSCVCVSLYFKPRVIFPDFAFFRYHPSTCTQRTGRGVVWHAVEPQTWFPKSGLGGKKGTGNWAGAKLAVCKSLLSITKLLLSSISIRLCQSDESLRLCSLLKLPLKHRNNIFGSFFYPKQPALVGYCFEWISWFIWSVLFADIETVVS